MTSQEKAINLWYLFLTYKPGEKNPSIHSPLSSACIDMFQFFQKSIFEPNTCTTPRRPNNGFRWCPLGKLSHLGLEQLNAIMKNRRKIKGEQNLIYNLKVWKKNDAFDILNDISENVTLVQLMDTLGNVNNSISIVGRCIFYYNHEKSLCLTQ